MMEILLTYKFKDMEILILVGRILFGGYFIYNGYNHLANSKALSSYAKAKNIILPRISVIISGLLILFGGLGVLFGIWMELSLAMIAVFLLPVTFLMHNFWEDSEPQTRMNNQINFGKNLALLGSALMLISLL